MDEAEKIIKRCQAGTRNYEEANNLHAACYGMIGKLLAQTQEPVCDKDPKSCWFVRWMMKICFDCLWVKERKE